MRTKTNYEWDREATDEFGDIHEHYHAERLADVPSNEDVVDMVMEATDSSLVLVRDEYDAEDGELLDRQWAYVTSAGIPNEFDGGARVPKRFLQEFTRSLSKPN